MGGLQGLVGQRIRKLRKGVGITIEQAAGRVGLDPKYWGRAERGEKNLTLETIGRMLKSLGAEPMELFAIDKSELREEGEVVRSLMSKMGPSSRKQVVSLAKHLASTRK
jgi:transcriptional regulator with XRE-family HTH domain